MKLIPLIVVLNLFSYSILASSGSGGKQRLIDDQSDSSSSIRSSSGSTDYVSHRQFVVLN
jgi:hypothetical protein